MLRGFRVRLLAKKTPVQFPDNAGELGTDGTYTVGEDYQGVAMTLIDSMSTLAVLGNASEFQRQVHWLTHHVSSTAPTVKLVCLCRARLEPPQAITLAVH